MMEMIYFPHRRFIHLSLGAGDGFFFAYFFTVPEEFFLGTKKKGKFHFLNESFTPSFFCCATMNVYEKENLYNRCLVSVLPSITR